MSVEFIIIYSTFPDKKSSEKMARKLLEEKVAACVSVLPGVQSYFHWNNNIETSSEVLLMIKAPRSNFSKIEELIKKEHSYETPEIIGVPVVEGNSEYLEWIEKSTNS